MSKVGDSDNSSDLDSHSIKKLKTGMDIWNEPVEDCFKKYSAKLDQRYDRYERLVKLSRDITIESKRIIFLLHSVERDRENVLSEAKKRLDNLVDNKFSQIAKELKEEDPYLYHRAFTFGLQEFIEAYTFYHQLKDNTLNDWDFYQNLLKYNVEDRDVQKELITILTPADYVLGVADLSGELMRMCINNLGSGNIKGCFETCEVVKKLYAGFISFGSYKTRDMYEKTVTLRQNLLKMENVCYNINLRSKELPDAALTHLAGDFD